MLDNLIYLAIIVCGIGLVLCAASIVYQAVLRARYEREIRARRDKCRDAAIPGPDAKTIQTLARMLRFGAVMLARQHDQISETEARGLLAGPLTPGDDSSIVDDSALLMMPPADALTKIRGTRPADMRDAACECHWQEPYGFVRMAGCPYHDR